MLRDVGINSLNKAAKPYERTIASEWTGQPDYALARGIVVNRWRFDTEYDPKGLDPYDDVINTGEDPSCAEMAAIYETAIQSLTDAIDATLNEVDDKYCERVVGERAADESDGDYRTRCALAKSAGAAITTGVSGEVKKIVERIGEILKAKREEELESTRDPIIPAELDQHCRLLVLTQGDQNARNARASPGHVFYCVVRTRRGP